MKVVHHRPALAAPGALGLATLLWASSVIASAAMAAEYSWQVSGSYEDVDAEAGVETSHSSLRATYYPSSVDDQVGPYELAPFLNRSSYVGQIKPTRIRRIIRSRLRLGWSHYFVFADRRRPAAATAVG